MRHRYALLLLALAPALACAQTQFEARFAELTILSPDSLAATISNFDYSGIPQPPYVIPDTTGDAPDFIMGTSVFQAVTPQGDTVSRGTTIDAWGPMAPLALALNASGGRALGCFSVPDTSSDIANGADLAGTIAMVERGVCPFYVKARNVEATGAVAFLVFNPPDRDPDTAINMSGGRFEDPQIMIPGEHLPWSLARPLVEALEAGDAILAKLACDGRDFGCLVDAAAGRPSATGAGLFLAGENPTRGTPRLVVRAPSPERVTVAAYDVLGREVAVLHDGLVMGTQTVTLPAGLPTGSYFVRAVGETFRHGQQVTILR